MFWHWRVREGVRLCYSFVRVSLRVLVCQGLGFTGLRYSDSWLHTWIQAPDFFLIWLPNMRLSDLGCRILGLGVVLFRV